MADHDRAFLAQIAMGWFTVSPDGAIWRNVMFHGGGVPVLVLIEPVRAERSTSKKGGYLRVMFFDAGQRRQVSASRIVWMVANKRNIPAGMEINHLDGNKQNNHPSNLELTTHQGNAIHSVRVLGNKPKARFGETNAASKVTAQQVAEIRSLLALKSMAQREIAQLYGITQSAVSAIATGKSWASIG